LFNLASRQGDLTMAHELHHRLSPVLSMMEDEGKYTQFVKAGCSLVGHPVGPPRRPLLWPTPEEMARLQNELSALRTLPTPAVATCPNKTLRGESACRLSPSGEHDGEKGVR
jgi:dihydrodipicolinate synthase/N-acetylneuraminate lyase